MQANAAVSLFLFIRVLLLVRCGALARVDGGQIFIV